MLAPYLTKRLIEFNVLSATLPLGAESIATVGDLCDLTRAAKPAVLMPVVSTPFCLSA
jgi:hypothetical protein